MEGMKVCADCGVELVDTLEDMQPKAITFGTEDEITRLNEFLKYNQLKSGSIRYDEAEDVYELFVASEDVQKAKRIASIFKQEEALSREEEAAQSETGESAEELLEDITTDTNAGMGTVQGTGVVYENKRDKAENFKSSAYTLIIVGIAGAMALLLCKTGIIPFHLNLLTYGVMGVMFAVFLIMGISSYRSYKQYAGDAKEEEELKEEVERWCRENLTRQAIDDGLFQEEFSEEMKYFRRMEKMKQEVEKTFLNMEEGFLDTILEDLYPTIFDK
ncbi:MAG: hypothetical protein PHE02_09905 [Lachnospiraceae bacterium]|nr:hypothetical protein [Lachnospiraceae bacterium]